MKNKTTIYKGSKTARKKGLLMVMAASLVLVMLSVYKTPLFHNELHGMIVGVSQVHNEEGAKLTATVHLDSGAQVLASIPLDLQIREDGKARLIEGVAIFGHKSYEIVKYNEHLQ